MITLLLVLHVKVGTLVQSFGMNFDETIDICVSIDMSGSIGDDQAKDFPGEVKGIMDEYKEYNVKIWCFDTAVYNEEDRADGGKQIDDYKVKGGGGTDFMCNWNYMKDKDIHQKTYYVYRRLYMGQLGR